MNFTSRLSATKLTVLITAFSSTKCLHGTYVLSTISHFRCKVNRKAPKTPNIPAIRQTSSTF